MLSNQSCHVSFVLSTGSVNCVSLVAKLRTGIDEGAIVPLIAGLGAMLCITALSSLGATIPSSIWLMAPFGATMVILFGLPESPLAQPRNIIMGHLLTTAIGLSVATLIGVTPWSMGLAVGLAVGFMLLTETTHLWSNISPTHFRA